MQSVTRPGTSGFGTAVLLEHAEVGVAVAVGCGIVFPRVGVAVDIVWAAMGAGVPVTIKPLIVMATQRKVRADRTTRAGLGCLFPATCRRDGTISDVLPGVL